MSGEEAVVTQTECTLFNLYFARNHLQITTYVCNCVNKRKFVFNQL